MSLTLNWRQKLINLVLTVLLIISHTALINAQTKPSKCAPPEKSDWERDGLRGRVKSTQTYKTWFTSDEKSGKLVEQRSVFPEEGAAYGSNGNRDGGGEVIHAPYDGKQLDSIRYLCDKHDRLKEIRFVATDGTSYARTGYLYDEKGFKKEKTDYFPDGSVERKETYNYDDAGNLIEEIEKQQVHPEHFNPKRYDVYVTTNAIFKWDSRKNKIEEKHFYPDGSLYATWIYKYDSKNRLIKETRTDKTGRLEDLWFHVYDRAGRPLAELHYANFCRERDGSFCKGTVHVEDGVFYYATKTIFKYDHRGNWIKQTEFTRGSKPDPGTWVISSILYRKLSYYKPGR